MISCQGEVEKKNTTYFGYQIKIMTLTNHKNTWFKWQVTNPVAGCTKSNVYLLWNLLSSYTWLIWLSFSSFIELFQW